MAQEDKFKIVSLKYWSEITSIGYFKLRDNFVTRKYNSLKANEKTQLANALFSEVKKIFSELGFEITIRKFKDSD